MKLRSIKSILKTPTYVMKEYFHRRPDPAYQPAFGDEPTRARAVEHIEVLRREGIILLPGYFSGDRLTRLKTAFEEIIRDHVDEGGNPDASLNSDFMKADPVFLEVALDDLLLQIMAGYYGKPFVLGRASAFRLQPTAAQRYGSFQWHHDGRGRQLHMMVLVNEVPSHGQRMVYLRRSHGRYYDHYRGTSPEGSRFERDLAGDPATAGQITEVIGPAGTVSIFDSNGLHSGNRNDSVRRDTLTLCYVTSRNLGKIAYPRQLVQQLSPAKMEVLTRNPSHQLV